MKQYKRYIVRKFFGCTLQCKGNKPSYIISIENGYFNIPSEHLEILYITIY